MIEVFLLLLLGHMWQCLGPLGCPPVVPYGDHAAPEIEPSAKHTHRPLRGPSLCPGTPQSYTLHSGRFLEKGSATLCQGSESRRPTSHSHFPGTEMEAGRVQEPS